MIYENKVILIIMVCNLIENKILKCHKYWNLTDKNYNFSLENNYEKEIDPNLIEREFTLKDLKSK